MSSSDKYTDPELREEIKEEVKAGDKGGAPGQWSARKAQMMASEYKKRGGDYTTDKETGQDESQKHLSEWGEEEWQTKEGSGNAKQADGTQKRYLPKKAWEHMTEEEKEATEKKKEEGSKEGKQHVENTEEAKEARANAQNDQSHSNGHEANEGTNGHANSTEKNGKEESVKQQNGNHTAAESNGDHKTAEKNGDEDLEEKVAEDKAEAEGDEEYIEEDDDDEEEEDEVEQDEEGGGGGGGGAEDDVDGKEENKTGQKRSRPEKSTGPSKKQKSTRGTAQKSGEPPAPQGSVDRLPKEGQKVSWHTLAGYVHGTVTEIATEEKEVEGKKVKGATGDPRIVLKTDNGKVAVHRADAVYFD